MAGNTKNILNQRGQARIEGNWEEAQRLDKAFRKSLRIDKTMTIMNSFRDTLDIRSKWMDLGC